MPPWSMSKLISQKRFQHPIRSPKDLNNQTGYITFQENSCIASFLLHGIYHKTGHAEEIQEKHLGSKHSFKHLSSKHSFIKTLLRHQVLNAMQQSSRANGSNYKVEELPSSFLMSFCQKLPKLVLQD